MPSKKKPAKTSTPAPVWSHSARSSADAAMVISYCAGRDMTIRPMADESLIPYDIQTNRAHCAMLAYRRIISPAQLAAIESGLTKIEQQWAKGTFEMDPSLEDVHINIERAVARLSGEGPAGVMHTARSRNDQTATDIRLWMRDQLLQATEAVAGTVERLSSFARQHSKTVLAGWTHGQPAMPTSLGHWALGHAQGLARDLDALQSLWPAINLSPLGAAAGFGSSWPIDREWSAKMLGFDGPQINSLDCVSTRWELESRLGFAMSMVMTHLSSLGQDIFFLSSPPRRLIDLDPAFTTGSSIMPQKRNPDFAEVTRARAASVQSMVAAMGAVGRGALSGYNRDSQWTKYWIMDLMAEVGPAPQIFAEAIHTMKPNKKGLAESARQEFVSAVDLADYIASSRGVEFRRLYHVIAEAVWADMEAGIFRLDTINGKLESEGIEPALTAAELESIIDPMQAIEKRASLGGPSSAQTLAQCKNLDATARDAKRWVGKQRKQIEKVQQRLRETIEKLIQQ